TRTFKLGFEASVEGGVPQIQRTAGLRNGPRDPDAHRDPMRALVRTRARRAPEVSPVVRDDVHTRRLRLHDEPDPVDDEIEELVETLELTECHADVLNPGCSVFCARELGFEPPDVAVARRRSHRIRL